MWVDNLVSAVNEWDQVIPEGVKLTEGKAVGLLRAAADDDGWGLVVAKYRDKAMIKGLAELAGVHTSTVKNGLDTCLRRVRTYYKKNRLPANEASATPREVAEAIREWGRSKSRKRRPLPAEEAPKQENAPEEREPSEVELLLNEVLRRLDEVERKVDAVDTRLKNEGLKFRGVVKLLAHSLDKEYYFIKDVKRATTAFAEALNQGHADEA